MLPHHLCLQFSVAFLFYHSCSAQGRLTAELQTHLWKLKKALHWNVARKSELQAIKNYITGIIQLIN